MAAWNRVPALRFDEHERTVRRDFWTALEQFAGRLPFLENGVSNCKEWDFSPNYLSVTGSGFVCAVLGGGGGGYGADDEGVGGVFG